MQFYVFLYIFIYTYTLLFKCTLSTTALNWGPWAPYSNCGHKNNYIGLVMLILRGNTERWNLGLHISEFVSSCFL